MKKNTCINILLFLSFVCLYNVNYAVAAQIYSVASAQDIIETDAKYVTHCKYDSKIQLTDGQVNAWNYKKKTKFFLEQAVSRGATHVVYTKNGQDGVYADVYNCNKGILPREGYSSVNRPGDYGERNSEYHVSNSRQSPSSEKRLALLIGNSMYDYGGVLTNPGNDIRGIEKALEELNFTVVVYENLGQKDMKKAIDAFGKQLKQYNVGLFFYAGHGLQVGGRNYLVPVDVQLESENDVEYDAVRADRVLAKMETAHSRVNIVILDACRDNPFERSWQRGAKGNGLAFMDAPSGTIIAYATSPGKTASDGEGSNGLYTGAILQHIKTPNIPIEQMFKRVRSTIMEWSGGNQVPWESTSLRGNFYFSSKEDAGPPVTQGAGMAGAQSSGFWELHPQVTDLLLYEAGYNIPPKADRKYTDTFAGADTRYIFWELKLAYPDQTMETRFEINAAWYNEDGIAIGYQDKNALVSKGWTYSWHSRGWGHKEPGKGWKPGKYTIKLYVNGKKLAERSFTVH